MRSFWTRLAEWSQRTFGVDGTRGPKGPLLHLSKEVEEALEAIKDLRIPCVTGYDVQKWDARRDKFFSEIVDCQFLIFDAARRSGLTYDEFVARCFYKLDVNEHRKWGPPIFDGPTEHIKNEKERV